MKKLANSSGPHASSLRQCSLKLSHVLSSSPHHSVQFWERCQIWLKNREERGLGAPLSLPWCYCDIQKLYSSFLPIFRHLLIFWAGRMTEISS